VKGPFWVEEQGQHLYLITLIDDHSRFCLRAKLHPFAPRKDQIINLLEDAIEIYGPPSLFSPITGYSSFLLEEEQITFPVGVKQKE